MGATKGMQDIRSNLKVKDLSQPKNSKILGDSIRLVMKSLKPFSKRWE